VLPVDVVGPGEVLAAGICPWMFWASSSQMKLSSPPGCGFREPRANSTPKELVSEQGSTHSANSLAMKPVLSEVLAASATISTSVAGTVRSHPLELLF
jgi:hypothetical protein